MGFQYGPDGVIIRPGRGVGTGLHGRVQGGLGARNDMATIASQIAGMNRTRQQLRQQGLPHLGRQAVKPAPVVSKPVEKPKEEYWATSTQKPVFDLPELEGSTRDAGDVPAGMPEGWGPDVAGLPGATRTSADIAAMNDEAERKQKSKDKQDVLTSQAANRVYNTTIKEMVEEVKKDPNATYEDKQVVELLADEFRSAVWTSVWDTESVVDNPLMRELNNISIWSTYRRQVSEWQANKNKLGTETTTAGDGSFSTMVTGSFSQKTGTGNVPGTMVARDSQGLLYITDVDTWINAKMSDMRKDPALAAQTITALASIQAYGGDTAANSAAGSRVVTDENGNPVKAFISNEDFTALKNVALLAVNSQAQGNQETLEDFFAELTAQSQEIYNDPQWEPPGGGSGSGYGGGYSSGGGYGGSGGGGGAATRFTDPEELGGQVDSIARQRMGRQLTTEEKAEFVKYYHALEQQMTAAYYSGMSTTQLDPMGQAVGWIESRFAQERGAQQYGNLAARFVSMMSSSNAFAGIGS